MLAINGHSGFIGQALLKELDARGIRYKLFDRRLPLVEDEAHLFLYDVTKIIFLSSPSDSYDFSDRKQTTESMMDNYVWNLNIILDNNPDIEIIFGSSVAVHSLNNRNIDSLDNSYAVYKLAIEHYIRSKFKKFRICRIPRVYGKDRQKGLMRKLKEKPIEEFENTKIKFSDIEDFIPEFVDFINMEVVPGQKYSIKGLQPDKTMTPEQIKAYYQL